MFLKPELSGWFICGSVKVYVSADNWNCYSQWKEYLALDNLVTMPDVEMREFAYMMLTFYPAKNDQYKRIKMFLDKLNDDLRHTREEKTWKAIETLVARVADQSDEELEEATFEETKSSPRAKMTDT